MGLGFARPALPATSFVQLQQIQHVHFVSHDPVLQIAALLSTLTWFPYSVRRPKFSVRRSCSGRDLPACRVWMTMAINVPINNTLMTWKPPLRCDAMEIWKRWDK